MGVKTNSQKGWRFQQKILGRPHSWRVPAAWLEADWLFRLGVSVASLVRAVLHGNVEMRHVSHSTFPFVIHWPVCTLTYNSSPHPNAVPSRWRPEARRWPCKHEG